MRVLVTRPEAQAARTARRLAELGHEPVVAPALEIAATREPLPKSAFDFVLATSAQAFAGIELPARFTALPLACVGEKTAQAGRKAGFLRIQVAPHGEALAKELAAEGNARSALYLAGRERKDALETILRAKNWRVEIVETYAATPVAAWTDEIRAALDAGDIDAVLHYSPRSAAIALALIGREAARRLRHYCLSPAVAAACRDWAPAEKIVSASHPDEESLMTLLSKPVRSLGDENK